MKDLTALYRHILALSAQSSNVRTQLHQLLTTVPREAREVIGNDAQWGLFLLDVESFLSSHTLALMLLDYVMRAKDED